MSTDTMRQVVTHAIAAVVGGDNGDRTTLREALARAGARVAPAQDTDLVAAAELAGAYLAHLRPPPEWRLLPGGGEPPVLRWTTPDGSVVADLLATGDPDDGAVAAADVDLARALVAVPDGPAHVRLLTLGAPAVSRVVTADARPRPLPATDLWFGPPPADEAMLVALTAQAGAS